MVQWNVDSITAVDPSELSAQEKDDLYESLAWLEPKDMTLEKYEPLFNVTKEIMKYKGEQVESLLADLDILASSSGGGNELLHEEITKANKQIEELLEEVQTKDKELESERLQVEKLLSEIGDLQKEKAELRREIVMIQSENQGIGLNASIGDDSLEDTSQLKEMIQHKNKHILQLLSDIQILEKENEIINGKLSSLRKELSEATTNLEKFSGENISLRQSNQEFQEKISTLEERNTALSSQVSELVEERNKRESHLDVLIDALDERVTKWQEILSQKDEEVAELRAKLSESVEASQPKGSMMFTANYLELTKTIEEQEEAIKKLHEQLKQATEDMSNCSIQVQELKQKADSKDTSENGAKTLEELKEELEKAQSQIHYLQEKANDAEQDAQFRAEEMTELIIQLKEYEEGVYGLSEARSQVKELKRQLKTRDNQILKLIEQINHLTLQLGEGEQINLENFEKYFDSEDQTSQLDLQTQLNAIQQTAINLSMQNFELRAEIVKLKQDHDKKTESKEVPKVEPKNDTELEEKLRCAIEENESLRKGLHEILESIQNHDGSRSVVIESECLERLLEALDARHIAGWYHPAMRIQAALNKMQGNNEALRQELRESRLRESYFQAELQSAMMQVEELQEQLQKYYVPEHPVPIPAPRKNIGVKTNASDEVDTDTLQSAPTEGEKAIEEVLETNTESVESDDVQTIKISDVRVGEQVDRSIQTDTTSFLETTHAEVQTDLRWTEIIEGKSEPLKERMQSPNKEVLISDENENNVNLKEEVVPEKIGVILPEKEDKTDTEKLSKSENPEDNSTKPKIVRQESSITDSNGSPKLKEKLSLIENDLKKKCDELKSDFESIKKANESTILELQKNKQELHLEVERALQKVSEEMKKMKDTEASKTSVNEFTLGAFQEQEAKLLSYGIELGELRRGIAEKESYIAFLETRIKESNDKAKEASSKHHEQEEKRIKSLKETISGLQQIVSQKEATCHRYKALLEESNAEYRQLLEKYHSLEKNRNTVSTHRDPMADSKSVSILMEKWIARVRGLESEIESLNRQLMEAHNELESSKMETEHWRNFAESLKEKTVDEFTLENNRREIEELRLHIRELKEEAEIGFQNRIKTDNMKFKEKEDNYKYQIKSLENEITRLKHQLNIRSAKSTTKTVKKEVLLIDKIKALEEEIEKYKERERAQLQMRRDKCVDEVSKWEEKKRLQTTNEKFKQELKEKTNLIEQMEGQISRLKVIIARMERERISLKRRLKTSDTLLAKSMSEEDKTHDYDDNKSYATESRFETPVLDSTPRSPAESITSELHDPKIKTQSRRDLVRAITALKKVISRLRSEHSNYYHKDYVEQLQNELRKMENNYMDAVERALALEEQMRETEAKLCGQTYIVDSGENLTEVTYLKELLAQKCALLMKVKVLLQRALLREKQLIHQVTLLEKLVPPEKLARLHEEAREM